MFKTLGELIQDVHTELRLVPGASVQVYSEDYTSTLILREYYALAREPSFWWPHFMQWSPSFLCDGVSGLPTISFNTVDAPWQVRHEDIKGIWPANSHRKLTQWHSEFNPTLVTFTRPYVEYINNQLKLFRILPLTTTESFIVHYRNIPRILRVDDLVMFDDAVLVNKVAWISATKDGLNPTQAITFLNRFEVAFNRVKIAYSQSPIELDPAANEIPQQWYETPAP